MLTTDKNEISYWENIQINDLIQLSDEQTIEYLMGEGVEHIEHGADFTVTRKRVITAQDGPTKWFIYNICLADFVWFVVVKAAGVDFDVKIYFLPGGFEEGNRDDIIDNDFAWLFEEPEDTDNYESSKLAFTSEFEEDDDTIFKVEEVVYGECKEGSEKSFATVVEYLTSSDIENPEMMVLELNNVAEW